MGILQTLLKDERTFDCYVLCRYMYRVNKPLANDHFYEQLEKYCKSDPNKSEVMEAYLNRTYDDDPVPLELLQEFGLENVKPSISAERQQYKRYLEEDKSLSILAVTEYADAHSYFIRYSNQRLIMMIKVDGVNEKSTIQHEPSMGDDVSELKLSLSRGRTGDSFDYTDGLLRVVPRYYKGLPPEVTMHSECYVESDALEYLRNKYDPDKFKMEKSSAGSMLRVLREEKDYKYLKSLTFSLSGVASTISGSLEKAKEVGLDIVPYLLIEPGEAPLEYDEFVNWLRGKFDAMFTLGQGIPSDGIVVDIDNLLYESDVKNQYSSRNIALKMEYWAFDRYVAKIKDIVLEQKHVEKSVRLALEPVMAKDRSEAKMLNGYNPDIIFTENMLPGQMVVFERNSGAINSIVRGGVMEMFSKEKGQRILPEGGE